MTELGTAPRDWLEVWSAIHAGAFGDLHARATHNVQVDTSLDRIYGRQEWIAALTAECTGFSLQGVADSVAYAMDSGGLGSSIFVATAVDALSHGLSMCGSAAGVPVRMSSAVLGLVADARIYRAWRFVDHAAVAEALGVDLRTCARSLTLGASPRGGVPWEYGDVRASVGQRPPPASYDPVAGVPEALHPWVSSLLQRWNDRQLGPGEALYARDAQVSRGFAESRRGGSVIDHPWWSLVTALPDAVLFFERGCAAQGPDGGVRLALLWRWIGRHTGVGLDAEPSGHRLHVRGLSHLDLLDDQITHERIFFDRLGPLADIERRRPP